MNLGEKLKQLRLEKNLTQKQLADRLGVAISAISSYESDTRCPTFDTLIKYARIFHGINRLSSWFRTNTHS